MIEEDLERARAAAEASVAALAVPARWLLDLLDERQALSLQLVAVEAEAARAEARAFELDAYFKEWRRAVSEARPSVVNAAACADRALDLLMNANPDMERVRDLVTDAIDLARKAAKVLE